MPKGLERQLVLLPCRQQTAGCLARRLVPGRPAVPAVPAARRALLRHAARGAPKQLCTFVRCPAPRVLWVAASQGTGRSGYGTGDANDGNNHHEGAQRGQRLKGVPLVLRTLLCGASGAAAAAALQFPLPYMLGSLLAVSAAALGGESPAVAPPHAPPAPPPLPLAAQGRDAPWRGHRRGATAATAATTAAPPPRQGCA